VFMVNELIKRNRSIRRFSQETIPSIEQCRQLVDLARKAPATRNLQPLKYIISTATATNQRIFSHVSWAGYLQNWDGPKENEHPTAYIVILHDSELSLPIHFVFCDAGLASQNILLGATEMGFGGCILGSFNPITLQHSLEISERYKPVLVVALGKPGEKVTLEETGPDGDIRYYRDNEDIHHVPKRPLSELILYER